MLTQPAYRQFYDRLTSPRFRTLSRMLPAFGSHVFLTGPESVPQELVDDFSDGALPEKFFFTVDAPSDVQH